MRWEWFGATPMARSDFGDPVDGATGYQLCIYDTNDGPPTLAFSATIPAGGTCGRRTCWKQNRRRLVYVDTAAARDGIRQITLTAVGRSSRTASVVVSGNGPNLHLPAPPDGDSLLRESPQVIVQLQRSDQPACWEAVFAGPPIHDTGSTFVDGTR
jgi:hypothetical protein